MVCADCSCERCERAMREERERFSEQMKQENPDCKKYNLDENSQWGYEICFCVGCLA